MDANVATTPRLDSVTKREREGPPPLKRTKKCFNKVDMYARETETLQMPPSLDQPATFRDVLDTSDTVEAGSDFWSNAVLPKSNHTDRAPPAIKRVLIRWDSKTAGKILIHNLSPAPEPQQAAKKSAEPILKSMEDKRDDGAPRQKMVRWDSKIAGKVFISKPSPKSEDQQATKKDAEPVFNSTENEIVDDGAASQAIVTFAYEATPSKTRTLVREPPALRKSKRLLAKTNPSILGPQPKALFKDLELLPVQERAMKKSVSFKTRSGATYAAHSSAKKKKNVSTARAA
jgi:hypothetical protein